MLTARKMLCIARGTKQSRKVSINSKYCIDLYNLGTIFGRQTRKYKVLYNLQSSYLGSMNVNSQQHLK